MSPFAQQFQPYKVCPQAACRGLSQESCCLPACHFQQDLDCAGLHSASWTSPSMLMVCSQLPGTMQLAVLVSCMRRRVPQTACLGGEGRSACTCHAEVSGPLRHCQKLALLHPVSTVMTCSSIMSPKNLPGAKEWLLACLSAALTAGNLPAQTVNHCSLSLLAFEAAGHGPAAGSCCQGPGIE